MLKQQPPDAGKSRLANPAHRKTLRLPSSRTRNSWRFIAVCLRLEIRGKAGQLYGMGLIGGFCHLYIGQEAVVVGMQSAAQRG